ncbi:Uncharacterised protein [Mycobacterium tuberculosis]|uniref:Uncharacterized protein n=1 Tax=Mycobacterium tuberculosis TaxID=1773 RepID=A0A654ZTD6_MYCTX|nr:Uncharacterised protein [Mycobacterium tuberculosis]
MGGQCALHAAGDDLLRERIEVAVWHEVVGESQRDGVGAGKRRSSQGGVQTQRAGCTRQQIHPADVGDEPDAHFGHRDLGGIGNHPGVRVCADADAAAHYDAVHQRHVGLGEPADQGVEQILVAPEPPRLDPVLAGTVVDGHHVPAGAKSAFAGSGEHHRVHRVLMLPAHEHCGQQVDHGLVQ